MIPHSEYLHSIRQHYRRLWGDFDELEWLKGPTERRLDGFTVLRFAPSARRSLFAFATCRMSEGGDAEKVECFVLAPASEDSLCELLTVVPTEHR